jgi:hypothetical protein
MLRLGLASVIVTRCGDSLVPRIGICIALRRDIVGNTVDDEIGNHFGKVYNIFCDNVGKRKYRLDDKVKKV